MTTQRQSCCDNGNRDWSPVLWGWERSHKPRPLEAGKVQEMDSLHRALRGNQPCQHLDFSPINCLLISRPIRWHWTLHILAVLGSILGNISFCLLSDLCLKVLQPLSSWPWTRGSLHYWMIAGLQLPTLNYHNEVTCQFLPWETRQFWEVRSLFVVKWDIWITTGFLLVVLYTTPIKTEIFHES
jgi:hypothetical protein